MSPHTQHHAFALLALVSVAACGPAQQSVSVDLVPPHVVSVTPGPAAVPPAALLTVRFSKPIAKDRIYWTLPKSNETVPDSVLVGRVADRDALVRAADNPPLSKSERAKTVEAAVTLSADRTTLTVAPSQPLQGTRDYVLVLSRRIADEHLNGLCAPGSKVNATQVWAFSTDFTPDDAPPAASLDSPPPGTQGVPTDLPRLAVRFTKPIDSNSAALGRIGLLDLTQHLSLEPAALTWSGTDALLALRQDIGQGCATLCPSHSYALYVDPTVTDVDGHPVQPVNPNTQSFVAASCLREVPPDIAPASIRATPSDRGATLAWLTDEPSSSRVVYTPGGADALAACLKGGSCETATGPDASCWVDPCAAPDEANETCRHTVRLPGLEAQATYTFAVESQDAGGRQAQSAASTFTTLAPLPRLVLSELFASPVGLTDENGKPSADLGKFVEIYNADSQPVDLTPTGSGSTRQAWALARCADATCTGGLTRVWPMKPIGSATVLQPGGFALAVGQAFDPVRVGVPFGTILLGNDGTSRTVLGNSLSKSAAAAYALLAPGGVVVSTYGGWLGVPSDDEGHSFERIDPTADDDASGWATATDELLDAPGNFATPGRRNSRWP